MHTIAETALADFNNHRRGRVWLVYNEPDLSSRQCGKFPEHDAVYAAHHYSDVYDMIKGADPYARVFGGGLVRLNLTATRNWWQTFLNTLQADGALYKLEGVHVHLYPTLSTSISPTPTPCPHENCLPELAQAADDWYQQMHVGLGLGNRPTWITETGWGDCSKQQPWIRDHFMQPMSQWFANDPAWQAQYPGVSPNPGYDAMSWYVTYYPGGPFCQNLLDSLGAGGAPTPLGTFWNNYQP